jgi:DNA-binding PadR family transcriptional regulator
LDITPLTYEILLALADQDRHGYGTIKEIEGRGGTAPSTGAMYLALHRMQAEGLVREVPTPAGSDSRRRYYRITDEGRAAAEQESTRLARLLEAARAKKLLKEDAA